MKLTKLRLTQEVDYHKGMLYKGPTYSIPLVFLTKKMTPGMFDRLQTHLVGSHWQAKESHDD